jgi:hypothetical protein
MSDATYTPVIYMKQGGDELVIGSGGKITNDGTQASHIATFTATGTFSTAISAKINSLINACQGVGILATS